MMFSTREQIDRTGADAGSATDGNQRLERILASLCDDRLAERIQRAARLATVEHARQTAQEAQSAVEAENSTE